MGRLFDAVASLVGIRHRVEYEAQAAVELEALVDPSAAGVYPVEITGDDPAVMDPVPLVQGVVADLVAGTPIPTIAARFHRSLTIALVEVCRRVHTATGLSRIVLSGGVFQNVTFLDAARQALTTAGFEVFRHRVVPPNDGGIALGQAVVAQAQLELTAGGAGCVSACRGRFSR
jgi:hydrogenase maturation protein HypF